MWKKSFCHTCHQNKHFQDGGSKLSVSVTSIVVANQIPVEYVAAIWLRVLGAYKKDMEAILPAVKIQSDLK